MKEFYKEHLFNKHILVRERVCAMERTDVFPTLVTLASKFGIRITDNAMLACPQMIYDCAEYLGEYVPDAFYMGFPASVRELSKDELWYDQQYHYLQTYGMGWFEQAGHSILEQIPEKVKIEEHVEPKDFVIMGEDTAEKTIIEMCQDMLKGNRLLNPGQLSLIHEAWLDFGLNILPGWIPCKDTVVRMLYFSKHLCFTKYLQLSDTIKLLNHIQYEVYGSENLKKLNLRNQDRKLITRVLDVFFLNIQAEFDEAKQSLMNNSTRRDMVNCFEKKKIWCGLLHHIHYQPKTHMAKHFVNGIRESQNISYMSDFERLMRGKCFGEAAQCLKNGKGESELVRHLNYILSRCEDEKDVEEVLKCLE